MTEAPVLRGVVTPGGTISVQYQAVRLGCAKNTEALWKFDENDGLIAHTTIGTPNHNGEPGFEGGTLTSDSFVVRVPETATKNFRIWFHQPAGNGCDERWERDSHHGYEFGVATSHGASSP